MTSRAQTQVCLLSKSIWHQTNVKKQGDACDVSLRPRPAAKLIVQWSLLDGEDDFPL